MRATGRQAVTAVVNFVCYYLIGLPIGISLALPVGMGSKGMWIGLSIADLIQVEHYYTQANVWLQWNLRI